MARGWEYLQVVFGGLGDERPRFFLCNPSFWSEKGWARGPRDGASAPLFRHQETNGRRRLNFYCGGLVGACFLPDQLKSLGGARGSEDFSLLGSWELSTRVGLGRGGCGGGVAAGALFLKTLKWRAMWGAVGGNLRGLCSSS